MENRNICILVYIVTIHFGISLMVSGIPLIGLPNKNNSPTSSEEIIIDDTNTTSNGTHKDL